MFKRMGGGGGKRFFKKFKKKLHFSCMMASLMCSCRWCQTQTGAESVHNVLYIHSLVVIGVHSTSYVVYSTPPRRIHILL